VFSLASYLSHIDPGSQISVAQNVFQNRLLANIKVDFPDINLSPATLLGTGATNLRNVVPPEYLPPVLAAFNKALSQTFYVGVAGASLSIFGSMGLEWRSVKKKEGGPIGLV
jgi:hypothetical protein